MNTDGSFRNVINLGNSIIGVSILAMPYCFHKCGILLSILIILASGCLTKATCHLLLKAAIMGRRRNFEFLAFHTFGTMGKFAVELGIIGFLLGACIAFFVVVGDLGPPLIADIFLLENTSRLRVEVLLILGFFVGLPLGLLKRVESLTSCSTLSVCFYVFLIFKILIEALPNLSYEKFFYEMNWWQPSGLLSCLPIFAMALSCQTQLFEIFDTHNDPNLKRMDSVVSSAVNLCSIFYTMVGLFGYAAFYNEPISGNVLVKLPNTDLTKLIKLCFVLTIVVSFPLCLFPCRSSLHSLLFKPGVSVHDVSGNLIPDHRFRLLTFLLVAVTIGTAIMVPNIEFVLGLLGSTIGAIISFILPAMVFIRMTSKNTNERLLAKFVFCVGTFILIACSYSTLNESARNKVETQINSVIPFASSIPKIAEEKPILKIENQIPVKPTELKIPPDISKLIARDESKMEKDTKEKVFKEPTKEAEKRQEPPIPQEPEEVLVKVKEKEIPPPTEKIEEKAKDVPPSEEPKIIEPIKESKPVIKESLPVSNSNSNDIDPDALKKEDKELKIARLAPNLVEQIEKKAEKKAEEAERKAEIAEKKAEEASQKQDELLRKIEAQQREQKKLLEEQRKLLLELKEHKESHHKDEDSPKPVSKASEFSNNQKPSISISDVESNPMPVKPPQAPILSEVKQTNIQRETFKAPSKIDNVPKPKIRNEPSINQNSQLNNLNSAKNNGESKPQVYVDSKFDTKYQNAKEPDGMAVKAVKPLITGNNPSKTLEKHRENVVETNQVNAAINTKQSLENKNEARLKEIPQNNLHQYNVNNIPPKVRLADSSNLIPNNDKIDNEIKLDNHYPEPKPKRVDKINLNIPVAKRLSDSFQNKPTINKNISKRSVTADPYQVNFNISKPDANINPSKMSYVAVKNEIRRLLEYRIRKERKDKKT